MSRNGLSFLRPSLNSSFVPAIRRGHARAYLALQRSFAHSVAGPAFSTNDYQQRVNKLEQWREAVPDLHPRLKGPTEDPAVVRLTPTEFHERFGHITETVRDSKVEIFGRVASVRTAGSNLVFLNIQREGVTVQVLCNGRIIKENSGSPDSFKAFKNMARKGDWYSAVGYPCVTPKGTVSVEAVVAPTCLAPSLHQIPEQVDNEELLARRPHVKTLIDAEFRSVIALRDRIKGALAGYLRDNGFIEVETPILEVGAGGANARPFLTESTELSRARLKLRVAPELSLKRLIVGGHERIFEYGKSFRNEGIDSTHNPEFTTCEFYEVGATLESLMGRTQDLFVAMADSVSKFRESRGMTAPAQSVEINSEQWQRLPFIPTIEAAINRKLPILTDQNAFQELLELFDVLSIPLPSAPNLPRLLEELEDRYIQPLCVKPTFVTHHPECLSPLAKSFVDGTGQRVAARAELHIEGREYVNCYEEENSPFEQRRKFAHQAQLRTNTPEEVGPEAIDESYLEVLEWGMPPTGGWGCGVDRLAMFFAGKDRIADVLPFGNLRNAVAMAGNGRGRR